MGAAGRSDDMLERILWGKLRVRNTKGKRYPLHQGLNAPRGKDVVAGTDLLQSTSLSKVKKVVSAA